MYGKKMATGGLVEHKAKRPNPYDGNEPEADEVERETESQNFAHGGMSKEKLTKAHEKARELMPQFQKEYGKEKGKSIAYATMTKQAKEGMAEGGEVGKKGAVMAIVARLAKKPSEIGKEMGDTAVERAEEGGGEEGMGGMREAKMAAAEEVMSALKSGDREGFAGALENFMKACGDYE